MQPDRIAAHLAGRQPDRGVLAFLGEQLGERPGGPDDLAALAGISSMLWIVVPSGMFASGRALPTRASAPGRRRRRPRP
jgi:hypothetical protein